MDDSSELMTEDIKDKWPPFLLECWFGSNPEAFYRTPTFFRQGRYHSVQFACAVSTKPTKVGLGNSIRSEWGRIVKGPLFYNDVRRAV